jgi:hypothetical protein
MSTPVSDLLSTPASEAAADSAAPDLALVAPATPGFILSTVDLSEAAQALSLQEQDNTPFEIAQALGTSLATVDGYLGITVSANSTAPVPPASATQEAPTQSSTIPNRP